MCLCERPSRRGSVVQERGTFHRGAGKGAFHKGAGKGAFHRGAGKGYISQGCR